MHDSTLRDPTPQRGAIEPDAPPYLFRIAQEPAVVDGDDGRDPGGRYHVVWAVQHSRPARPDARTIEATPHHQSRACGVGNAPHARRHPATDRNRIWFDFNRMPRQFAERVDQNLNESPNTRPWSEQRACFNRDDGAHSE